MTSAAGVLLPIVVLGYGALPLLVGVVGFSFRVRERPSAPIYGVLVAVLTILVAALLATDLRIVRRIGVSESVTLLATLAGAVLPVVWVAYAMVYTGRGDSLTRRRLLGVCGPLLGTAAVLAFAVLAPSGTELLGSLVAVVLLIAVAYVIGLLVVGAYLLGKLVTTYDHVPARQVGTQAVSVVAPYLVFVLANATEGESGPPLLAFDAVYVVVFLSAVGIAVTTWRYQVCTVVPEAQYVARDEVVETLREGVVVLDRSGHVLDVNRTATELLNCSPEAIIGRPIEALLDADIPPPGTPTRTVTVQTESGLRQLEVSVSQMGENGGASVGQTLVIRDVTERETRKQRLKVLNRVLRHNLRNGIDAILANARALNDDNGRGETIRGLAGDIARVSKKARDAEQLLEADPAHEKRDLSDVVHTTVDRVRDDYPDSDITVTAPGAASVTTDRRVLTRVLAELIENAIEHNDSKRPQVDLAVTSTDDRMEIAVADDGPGIPERERQVLVEGDETPLRHGSGIGLWLVNWGATYLGGTVSFADNEPSGSVVSILLPGETTG